MTRRYKITEWSALLGKECLVEDDFATWASSYGYLQNNYTDDEITLRQLKVREYVA